MKCATDNIFRNPNGRFFEIEEGEAQRRLLVSEYERRL
ncbi:D-lyxose/D-mannose family sugar isomerase [Celeribacter naphthalenivorans]|nr:D-lyxose/D-mannose family sugar isomerase [Celeribacter naphthalenivorans]